MQTFFCDWLSQDDKDNIYTAKKGGNMTYKITTFTILIKHSIYIPLEAKLPNNLIVALDLCATNQDNIA